MNERPWQACGWRKVLDVVPPSADVTCASLVLNFWVPFSSKMKYLHELELSFKNHNFVRKPSLS